MMRRGIALVVIAAMCLGIAACTAGQAPAISVITKAGSATATPKPTPTPKIAAAPTVVSQPTAEPLPTPAPKPAIKQVLAGYRACYILKADGTLWAWGDNEYGQIGDGTKETRTRFVQILDDVKTITPNNMAIRSDGSLWAWGGDQLSPRQIMADVQDANTNCIVKTDGTLLVYGSRFFALGDGKPADHSSKAYITHDKAIKLMGGVRCIPSGGFMGAAIKKDSTLWVWGETAMYAAIDKAYRKAVTSGVDPLSPVKVLDGVSAAAGLTSDYSKGMIALKNDGTVLQWGYYIPNPRQTLPFMNAKPGNELIPGFPDIQKPFPERATAIAAYSDFFAVLEDGRLVTWGYDDPNDWLNSSASIQDKDGPVGWEGPNQLGEYHEIAQGAAAVSAGCDTLLVLMRDGSLWAAGKASYDAGNPDAVSESITLQPAFHEMWGNN